MATVVINGTAHVCETGVRLSDVPALWGKAGFPCGGHGRCGKCRVVVKGEVSPVTQEERQLLSPQELAAGVRLACRTYLQGDCQITTATSRKAYVLGNSAPLSAADPLCKAYGAAVDVGTTTLAANLYASDGRLLAQAVCVNPQAPWGSDVISRIGAALEGSARLLAQRVRQGIDGLLKELASQAGIPVEAVDAMVITGNTAMLYLLTQTDPDCLSHGPFQADRLFGEQLTGAQLELSCPEARVYLPRCFGAFVGADIATALLASGITQEPGTRLLADIGTNGELALWDRGELLCCSTAAGPAFEGAGLSMGMPSLEGAIDHVAVEDGALKAHVLGEGSAVGICGSGVVDALAGLLELEQLDETGLLDPQPAVIRDNVVLTQKDVRGVQLAKSAIAAGILTLVKTRGLSLDQVDELAIAGGFGSYLDVHSAGRIGLIPQELVPRVRVLGNAALRGAAMLLLDQTLRKPWEEWTRQAKLVELMSNPHFTQAYMECMFF
ncbi:MAG: ASKHA domain-containing protein [Acutalibacter sp.]|jgi:uncharacterized 2Fe-2S/4Fe-4S cluster protein (DUF4445 family)